MDNFFYKGDSLNKDNYFKNKEKHSDLIPDPYLPDEGLIEAVNLAIFLERPLLLKGEPGCGKTKLAKAVAWELYGKDYPDLYFEWHIKSTTIAKEGLYSYDHIGRLRDTHLEKVLEPEPHKYIDLGPLGKAFISEDNRRPILLIDEIDKADIDFPNDLLRELDTYTFDINEVSQEDFTKAQKKDKKFKLNKENQAKQVPIVIITSNDEKELPEAFLRRCVYYYIKFPEDKLLDIVECHFAGNEKLSKIPIEYAIKKFKHLRKELKRGDSQGKNVSTSELIDWFRVLINFVDTDGTEKDRELKEGELPFSQVLLKGIKDASQLIKRSP